MEGKSKKASSRPVLSWCLRKQPSSPPKDQDLRRVKSLRKKFSCNLLLILFLPPFPSSSSPSSSPSLSSPPLSPPHLLFLFFSPLLPPPSFQFLCVWECFRVSMVGGELLRDVMAWHCPKLMSDDCLRVSFSPGDSCGTVNTNLSCRH